MFTHTVLVEFMVTSPVPCREAVKARYRDTLVVVKRVVPPRRIRQKRRSMFDLSTVAGSRGEETDRGTELSDIIVKKSSRYRELVADDLHSDSLTSRRAVNPAISSAFHQRLLTNFTAEMRRLVVVRHHCIV